MEQKTCETDKQFEEDIKWFIHNCRVNFPRKRGIQNASKQLIKCVKEHIQTIEIVSCDECYQNAYEYLTKKLVEKPCSKQHLLLWAKIRGYGYWPAKVMAIDKKEVYIQFFGEYSIYALEIMHKNCYLYSKEYPEKKCGRRSKLYSMALNVSFFRLEFDFEFIKSKNVTN